MNEGWEVRRGLPEATVGDSRTPGEWTAEPTFPRGQLTQPVNLGLVSPQPQWSLTPCTGRASGGTAGHVPSRSP